ncbi:flagellar motor control protein ZomB [Mycolicibacterium sp. P1-18]|uniref:flagellar motor control protein ZomB n=1 Tax=Mycolicibacterium sp. P1-18 TaxID=2024615 RepID=UPI00156650D9|nr:flagellar motor control protein ZomB [Mycolicibacterium sp. P1-18]
MADRLARWPAFRFTPTVRLSFWFSVVVVGVLFGWGAWQRRWIADDGLIVLRTVRNLLAGNGPVFNQGERVEANTSTVWTYLVTFAAWIGGPLQLEYVVLTLALTLSVAGLVFVMLGTGRLYAPGLRGRQALLLPAGAIVYIAIPPARDFATSGLENGLVLAYLGLLWWLMVCWSQAPRVNPPAPNEAGGNATGWFFEGSLAFVAGLSVLIRPELALIGGVALLMMLVAAHGWRRRLLIVVAGGLLPVVYQIFRMGYYGLLVPGTAVAKDASGSKWTQGFVYLTNFNRPYLLWIPLVLLGGLGLLLLGVRSLLWRKRGHVTRTRGRWTSLLQSPTAVVVFMAGSGLIQAVYWVRQGGDFMHGRVLLTPLFCLLAPIAVIPIVLPSGMRAVRGPGYLLAGASAVFWLAVVGWSLWAANSPGLGSDATRVTASGIVDERRFYAQATGHAHPLTGADYLDYPRMRAVVAAIDNTPDGALLLPSGNFDRWDVVPALPPPLPPPPVGAAPAFADSRIGPHTVFFTNLGMLGMNVGLNVRVIDQIGLANPLAAHTARLEDARIGHDKNLFPDWAVAEGPFLPMRPFIPPYLDEDWIAQAKAALTCPDTDAMLTSIRGPLGLKRFASNVVNAWAFTKYRIDRVPRYELARCGIAPPPPKVPPYTGMPATGP